MKQMGNQDSYTGSLRAVSLAVKLPYTSTMREAYFGKMKQFIGFDERDEANLGMLEPVASPMIPMIVDHFYEQLLEHDEAKLIFSGGLLQLDGLRKTLGIWFDELLTGPYDQAYYEKRRRIGMRHVRVGLPQHFMLTGLELIWSDLDRHLRSANISDIDDKLCSLHKLLMLDLSIILESYKESYSEQVRAFERNAVEEKLTRAEHLAEIGQLAASLAHEIKNPLAGISGAIQVIRDGMDPDDEHQPIVTEILSQISRLDDTVKDLLQYASPTPPRAQRVALNEIVTRVLSLLREEPALQRVQIAYDRDQWKLVTVADAAQLEQLLINLIINAAHASSQGGVVELGAQAKNGNVQLTVTDSGVGMSTEQRDSAFEAFYTTKAKGTGLGLSICKRIVEAHGGEIDLESEIGRGTRVTVTLPMHGPGDAGKDQG